MNTQEKVITRMAPSPTGPFHIGGMRTALYNYLHARKHGGTFILRIEDTDPERSEKKWEEYALESFKWLGIEFDELYRQSERTEIYQRYLEQLISEGVAYEAEEAKDGQGKVFRFKNPNKRITFQDEILGEVSVDTTELGDFVIARNRTSPVYHFVVVIDDFEMNITHVIRSQEHVANTARQILIQEAIGAPRPKYAHIPFIMDSNGKKKLSKRDGGVGVLDFKAEGYLPEAMINFLAFIGWNPGGEQEIYSLEALVENFNLTKVQKGGGVFNVEKLNWFNREWLLTLPADTLHAQITSYSESLTQLPQFSADRFERLLPVIIERISKFSDVKTLVDDQELQYFFEQPEYDAQSLVWKKSDASQALVHLQKVQELLSELADQDFVYDTVKETLWPYAEDAGKGDVLWPLRYALSGRDKSPDPFQLAEILGRDEVLARIDIAVQKLSTV